MKTRAIYNQHGLSARRPRRANSSRPQDFLCNISYVINIVGTFCACHPFPLAETCLQQSTFLAVCKRLWKKRCFVTKFRREEDRASSTVSTQFGKDVKEDDSASRPGGPARDDGGMESIPRNLKGGWQCWWLGSVVNGWGENRTAGSHQVKR